MRYKRFNIPNQPHALTFSCYRNRKFFSFKRTRLYFVDSVNSARIKHNFHVWAWVIMPDHVHLLIFPGNEDYSISEILKSIKQPVARKAINFIRHSRPELLRFMDTRNKHHRYRFWQDGGGYDRNIESHEELVRFVNYVHNNPVKEGLVETPEAWHWSSASEWLTGGTGRIKVDIESFPVM